MTNAKHVPFNRASLSGRELEYAFQAMADGQIAGNHGFSIKCEGLLQEALGVHRALFYHFLHPRLRDGRAVVGPAGG